MVWGPLGLRPGNPNTRESVDEASRAGTDRAPGGRQRRSRRPGTCGTARRGSAARQACGARGTRIPPSGPGRAAGAGADHRHAGIASCPDRAPARPGLGRQRRVVQPGRTPPGRIGDASAAFRRHCLRRCRDERLHQPLRQPAHRHRTGARPAVPVLCRARRQHQRLRPAGRVYRCAHGPAGCGWQRIRAGQRAGARDGARHSAPHCPHAEEPEAGQHAGHGRHGAGGTGHP